MRNTLILTSLGLLAILTLFYLQRHPEAGVGSASRDARSEEALEPPRTPGLTSQSGTTGRASPSASAGSLPPVQGQITNAQALRRDLLREIKDLQTTLSSRRQALAQRQAALEQLRTEVEEALSLQAQEGRPPVDSADLESRNEELQNLTASLEELRASREALRQEEEDAMVLRENATRLAIAQIDASLQPLEESRARAQAELELWMRTHLSVAGEPLRNPDLENGIARQQAQIEALRQQKLALTTDLRVQADSIYNLSQQVRSELRSQEQDVRSQIFSLQNEIRRAQRAQSQERMSRQSRASQVQAAQKALQAEAQQVKSLETSLESKQSELRKLE